MTPEGPYVSPWCNLPHFIVPDVRGKDIVSTVVPNGVQRYDGTPFPNMREARQWLKDNGFELKAK